MTRYSPAFAMWASVFWATVIVGVPTIAYWLSGGPLNPGWALYPTIVAMVIFLLFTVLADTKP